MKKNKILVVSLLILISSIQLFAQDSTRILLTMSPQHIFINALRFDVEYNLKKQNQWIGFAPQIYYNDEGDFFGSLFDSDFEVDEPYGASNSYDTLSGFGIEFYHKIFLLKRRIPEGFYFSYGATYNLFKLKYRSYDWVNYIEDGLEYTAYRAAYKHQTINKIGANFLLGYQAELSEKLYLDVYTGLGFRYSFHSDEANENQQFNNSTIGYGYSGSIFLFGIKFGVML